MQRDAQEALERLEQELLAEEQPEEPEEDYGDFLETEDGDEPLVYRNFSNNYGADLRNYANGYKAYNTDRVDRDPEQLSREVQDGKKEPGLWLPVATVALLAAGVLYILCLLLGGAA